MAMNAANLAPNFWQPPVPTTPQLRWNFPDATIRQTFPPQGRRLLPPPLTGYGIDLNGDGRFTQGQDGMLAFDLDRDGQLTRAEVERSNNLLKAFGGNYDFDGDGQVNYREWNQGNRLRSESQAFDRDRDGVLSAWELDQAGGRVFIDQNRDGRPSGIKEQYSVFYLPNGPFGHQSLDFVDPRFNVSWTTPRWFFPWGWPA